MHTDEIKYLDSFTADTSIVPRVIDSLIKDLSQAECPVDEMDEIVLAMDEAVTNAIQETLKKNVSAARSGSQRDITVRYTLTSEEFDATIIDHGEGLDLFNILQMTPSQDTEGYYDDVVNYASESEKQKLRVRVNGEEIPLRGIGAGLKIILSFMDSVTIDLIDREKILSTEVSEHTDGTIFTMKRKRRY